MEVSLSVSQVSVKQHGGYQLLSVQEFLDLPQVERTSLILARRIDFLAADGSVLPMLDAVKAINKTRAGL